MLFYTKAIKCTIHEKYNYKLHMKNSARAGTEKGKPKSSVQNCRLQNCGNQKLR